MRSRRVLLSFTLFVCSWALASPKMIPIASSFTGAAASSNPTFLYRIGSKVVFAANDGVHGVEPWITDGTPAGTTMITNLGVPPTFAGTIGTAAIFSTYDSAGWAYWKTDGTAAGTVKLLTIPNSNLSGFFVQSVFADTRFYVLVQQSYSGPVELYASDGTAAGTKDLGSFPAKLSPAPVGINGVLYFLAQDAAVGPQLWMSSGTTAGTHMVRRDVECPGSSCGPAPTAFFRTASKAMFLTADSLWTIGDRGASIQQTASMTNPAVYASSATAPRAFVAGADGTLWSTDGTPAGTVAIPGVNPSYAAQHVLDDGRLLFFVAKGSVYEVWKSDGTSAGTVKIGALTPFTGVLFVAALGGKVFLSAASSTTGTELLLADLDNLTVGLFDDIDPRADSRGPFSSLPGTGVALGAKVLFPATDFHGRELWQSDGTTAGTTLLANIAPDPGGGVISGTVRAASDGSPIAKADVYLCAPSGTGSCDDTQSDSTGHYHFDGVIPGTYAVTASAGSNYLPQYYEGVNCPCPLGSGTPVSVTAGVETSGVNFALIRGGAISGTVTRASTGQPVGANDGRLTLAIFDKNGLHVDSTSVGFDGHYTSHALGTGTYYAFVGGNFFSNGQPAVSQLYKNRNCPATGCNWQDGDPISVTNGVVTTGIDFSLHEYGTIAGTLRDDAGSPVPNFLVYFLPQGSTSASVSVSSDSNGAYVSPLLSPGSYYVLTDNGRGFATTVYPNGTCSSFVSCTPSGGSLVSVQIDGATTGINFQLAPVKGRITGTIRDSNGKLFPGVTVVIRDTNGYYVSAFGGPAQTDASGRYEFFNIGDGTYYVNAADQLYPGVDCLDNPCSTAAATPLIITAGHSARADMQLLSQRTTISGHLLDSVTHQPLTDGTVFLFDSSGRGLGNGFVESGTYQMTVIGRAKSYYMVGIHGGYHSAVYPNVRWSCGSNCSVLSPQGGTAIPAGTSSNIDISLDRMGSLSGKVTDVASGQPVPNVEVLFYSADGSGYATSALTAADGSYTVSANPGSYVSFTTGGYSYQPQIYNGRPCAAYPCGGGAHGDVVTVTDGVATTGIDYRLTALNQYGAISGHIVDAETGLPMPNVYVACGSFSARTDAHGYYFIGSASNVVQGLQTGQYTLYAETEQPYFIGLSGGGACEDLNVCRNNGTPIPVTAPNTTTLDFRMIKLRATSVAPAYGLTTGGTRLTITGRNFAPSASVLVGGNAASIVSVTPTQIVAVTPPGSVGAAHVTVRLSPSLAVTFAQAFTYVNSVTIPDGPGIPGTPIRPGHGLEGRGEDAVSPLPRRRGGL